MHVLYFTIIRNVCDSYSCNSGGRPASHQAKPARWYYFSEDSVFYDLPILQLCKLQHLILLINPEWWGSQLLIRLAWSQSIKIVNIYSRGILSKWLDGHCQKVALSWCLESWINNSSVQLHKALSPLLTRWWTLNLYVYFLTSLTES